MTTESNGGAQQHCPLIALACCWYHHNFPSSVLGFVCFIQCPPSGLSCKYGFSCVFRTFSAPRTSGTSKARGAQCPTVSFQSMGPSKCNPNAVGNAVSGARADPAAPSSLLSTPRGITARCALTNPNPPALLCYSIPKSCITAASLLNHLHKRTLCGF